MHIIIIGAGVIGATTAYYLAQDGHKVTVLERCPGPALECSFANGGQISAGCVGPLASPEALSMAFKWFGRQDAPLMLRLARWDPALWTWLAKFVAQCSLPRVRRNGEKITRLCLYSRQSLKRLRVELGLRGHFSSRGILHVFRDLRTLDKRRRAAAMTDGLEQPHAVLSTAELCEIEPALRFTREKLVGGLFVANDNSGDAHLFSRAIIAYAKSLGAHFRYNAKVAALRMRAGRIEALCCDGEDISADAYVLSCGAHSPLLARQAGLRLPIYPAKGYSLSLPVNKEASGVPLVSITDADRKLVFSRLGNELRAAGAFRLEGWDTSLQPEQAMAALRGAQILFPQAGDYQQVRLWACLRPQTPDSVPYICATPVNNLFLNTGHGALGWTMAVGSARVLADVIAGRAGNIDAKHYSLCR